MSDPSFDEESTYSGEPAVPGEPAAPPPEPLPAPAPSWRSQLATLATLIFRLLLLGVGISLGWIAGLLFAELVPARGAAPPLQEKLQRRTSQTVRKLSQLPQWWRGEEAAVVAPIATPEPEPAALSDAEAQLVESELSAMQAELDALDNRLSDLEQQLGRQPSTAPPAVRLRRLDQALSGESARAIPDEPGTEAADLPPTSPTRYSELVQDRVTLPSGVLFPTEQAELTLGGEQILETILPDLARSPSATILIGGYSDALSSPDANRERTFAQALSVQRYLESRLGDDYHWVAIGYGETTPIAAGAAGPRIEIAIVPAQ
ncbi:hypothetical protein C7271_21400 [filamentous cyanobacterium CCP5]|nr:hypothetical protein C7271_21400 [filamentous cyanobacterium CCP5]